MVDIPRVVKGDVITAKRLNEYGEGINDLNRKAVDPPKDTDQPPDPEVPKEQAEGPRSYVETSRTISQVQVFDQGEVNYALIDRIESITLANSEGETLTLIFTN